MRFLNIALLMFAAASVCAATKPVTYNPETSKLVQPSASVLVAANPELGMAINSLKRDFFVYVDMFPTPSDYNSYHTLTTNQAANLYYVKTTGLNYEYRTVSNNLTLSLSNNTNLVTANNGTMPTSYNTTDFSVNNLTGSIGGSAGYNQVTGLKTSLSRIVNSDGTYTYTTNDRIINLSYWTDCELKVIDKYGNIVYFTSTIFLNSSQVAQMHPEITDSNPTIYFLGTYGYATTSCYGLKTQFTNFNSSIGATIGTSNTVTGIWIYPDLNSTDTRTVKNWTGYGTYSGTKQVVWGEYIREVFSNPENTIIIWRQTTTQGEMFNGNKLWRPVLPVYYGPFKEVQ